MVTTGYIGEVTVDGKHFGSNEIHFLGSVDYQGTMLEGSAKKNSYRKTAMERLTSIWKDRGVTLETKVKLVNALAFPIVLHEPRLGQ